MSLPLPLLLLLLSPLFCISQTIPLIYWQQPKPRLFHELSRSWFWRGKDLFSSNKLKVLYQFPENYLRNEKKHNLKYTGKVDSLFLKIGHK